MPATPSIPGARDHGEPLRFAPPGRETVAGRMVRQGSRLGIGLVSGAIRVYQLVVSPAQLFLFGETGGCRFTPSCSVYAREAMATHGLRHGTALAARRICRCHPWGGCGHDPVPSRRP